MTPIPGFTRFCSFAEIWFAEIWFSRAELSKKPIGKLRSVASKGPDRARGMPSGHTPYTARTVAAASGSTGGKWYNVIQRKYRSARHAPTHSPLSRDQQPPRSAPGRSLHPQSATRHSPALSVRSVSSCQLRGPAPLRTPRLPRCPECIALSSVYLRRGAAVLTLTRHAAHFTLATW